MRLDRLRFVDEQPMHYVSTYIPLLLCPALVEMDVEHGSLYTLLRERFVLVVRSGRRTVEAVAAQPPLTALLGVRRGAPLLRMESISYLASGRPLEYYEAWLDGKQSRFEIQMVVDAPVHAGDGERVHSPFA